MGKIDDIFQDVDDKLNKLLDANEANIVKSLDKLEKKLIDAYQAGFPKSGKLNVAQAQKLQKDLIKIIERDYGIITKSLNKDYGKIAGIIENEFALLEMPFEFSINDDDLLNALKQTATSQFKQLGTMTNDKLAQGLYDNVATGGTFSSLVDSMRAALVGSASIKGTPLSTYAKQKAHDSLMNYYQQIQNKQADKLGIKDFIWYGSIMGSSRAKCIACAGRIFTEKEINAMDADKWRGKAPYPTMISVGGYHCRHHLLPVRKQWIKEGEIEIQSYYEENEEKYTPALRKEVNKELRNLPDRMVPEIKKVPSKLTPDQLLKSSTDRIVPNKYAEVLDLKMERIDVKKLDKAWKEGGRGLYIDSKGTNAIGDRLKGVEDYLKTGKSIEAVEISVAKNGIVTFVDGRHRFATFRDVVKAENLDVMMDAESLINAKKAGLI